MKGYSPSPFPTALGNLMDAKVKIINADIVNRFFIFSSILKSIPHLIAPAFNIYKLHTGKEIFEGSLQTRWGCRVAVSLDGCDTTSEPENTKRPNLRSKRK